MPVLFGLGAALTYGAADFIGGLMSRRARVTAVVFVSQLFGSVFLAAALPLFGPLRDASDLGWGAASGVAGGIGVLLLYRGLAVGRMSVVAPITAVVAAGIPVLFGLAAGERPSVGALAGVAVALVAVALISSVPEPLGEEGVEDPRPPSRAGLYEAVGSGMGFAGFFILLSQSGDTGGLWPLAGARAASLVLVATFALSTRRPLAAPRPLLPLIAATGLLEFAANLMFLLAVRTGLLSLVAVITSLYPASTVVLARIVLSERFNRTQGIGLALAAAGVALMSIG